MESLLSNLSRGLWCMVFSNPSYNNDDNVLSIHASERPG